MPLRWSLVLIMYLAAINMALLAELRMTVRRSAIELSEAARVSVCRSAGAWDCCALGSYKHGAPSGAEDGIPPPLA